MHTMIRPETETNIRETEIKKGKMLS